MKTIKATIRPYGIELPIESSLTLLENLQKQGIFVESVCGGKGTCGKCRVRFIKGATPPSESDNRHLSEQEIAEGWRLACQAKVREECEVFVPPGSREEQAPILSAGRAGRIEIDPETKKIFLELQPQTLEHPIGDVDLIIEALGMGDLHIDPEGLDELSHLLRRAQHRVTVTVAHGEISKVESGDTTARNFGLAIDIGTSTLVVSLIDLNSGEEKAVSARLNPQRQFGADVISRIQFCRENPGGFFELWHVLMEKLSQMIRQVCKSAGAKLSDISEAIVVGNPTMQHLFLCIDPCYIGESPYAPVISRKVRLQSSAGLGPSLGPFPAQTPPNLSGFIGSDIVGGIISQGLLESDEIQLLIDLGTNAEIVLGNKNRLLACNAAAGPAFEGAKIECGMIALKGAIDRVWFDEEDVEAASSGRSPWAGSPARAGQDAASTEDVRVHVIGDATPKGICGSGLVDAVACLLDLGILEPSGKMASPAALPETLSPKIQKRLTQEGKEIRFHFSTKVYVSQQDVRQLQVAKAAVAAGIEILTKKMGVETKQIQRVMIAGAFGSYVNPVSAKRIGLLPQIPLDRVISVGNSALEGAKMYLLSRRVRNVADRIRDIVELHELSAEKDFRDVFVSKIPFE
ncbi:MAG: ASKHA domain-containing protein [bacterium]|nr:ASKHA domain-containing protein [bacterium]